jgi:hypothetical protein
MGHAAPHHGAPDLFEAPQMHVFDTTFSYDTRVNKIDLISDDELDGSGRIVKNIDNQIMVRDENLVYFTVHSGMQVKPGDVFTVFRVERKIDHPRKKNIKAYLINLLAELKVKEMHTMPNGKVVYSGVIQNPVAEVLIGDRIMVMDRSAVKIRLNMAHVEMNGMIMAGPPDGEIMMRPGVMAFIDLGQKQGVEVGNSFSVWRQSDDPDNLPAYKIGNVIVMRVGERFSTVLVTYAIREIVVGDTILSDVH